MKNILSMFVSSIKEFKNIRSLTTAALLIALHTVMSLFLSVQVTYSLRISLSFITNVVTGALFGPVMGLVCAGLGDIIQFVLKPVGPYYFGWTLNAALAGFIYGCFFYKKFPQKIDGERMGAYRKFNDAIKQLLSCLLPLIAVFTWLAAPLADIVDKNDGSIIAKGSGYELVGIHKTFVGVTNNLSIIAFIILVSCTILFITSIMHLNVVPLIMSVICECVIILAVYNDRKTINLHYGFYCICIFLGIFILVKLWSLLDKHALDGKFMLRVVLVLLFDTLFVNVLLGTYWVSLLYGKGFMFYFTSRFVKNMVQLPINIILTYYVLGFIKNIKNKVGLN